METSSLAPQNLLKNGQRCCSGTPGRCICCLAAASENRNTHFLQHIYRGKKKKFSTMLFHAWKKEKLELQRGSRDEIILPFLFIWTFCSFRTVQAQFHAKMWRKKNWPFLSFFWSVWCVLSVWGTATLWRLKKKAMTVLSVWQWRLHTVRLPLPVQSFQPHIFNKREWIRRISGRKMQINPNH